MTRDVGLIAVTVFFSILLSTKTESSALETFTDDTRAFEHASTQPPMTPFERQKAERMLSAQLSCLGCHSLRGQGGRLGPALDSVQKRKDPGYIAAIISNPAQVRPGTLMPRVKMSARELSLLVRYFGGDTNSIYQSNYRAENNGTRNNTTSPGGARRNDAYSKEIDARMLYSAWCSGCHGVSGGGDGPNAPYLPVSPARHNSASSIATRSDDTLYDIIAGGGAIMNRSPRMPGFGGSLTPYEMLSLVRYIRVLCRCVGPSWSRG